MQAFIISDDITGALDSAVAFSSRGLNTVCAISPKFLPEALNRGADVVAVSTNSRELPAAEAIRIVAEVVNFSSNNGVRHGTIRIKKIDSRLKGHVAAEVTCMRSRGEPLTLCPAVPNLGRISVGGVLRGSGVDVPIPIIEAAGLPDAKVVDAESQAALDTEIGELDLHQLFVGAAGLCHALAARLAPGSRLTPRILMSGPALFAIGSRDPVTLAQLEDLVRCGFRVQEAPDGRLPNEGSTKDYVQVVKLMMKKTNVAPQDAALAFAGTIAQRVIETQPEFLIACGGETAAAILERLGSGVLDVLCEALPGVPVSCVRQGTRAMYVMTKSGGFGAADTLVRLIDMLTNFASQGLTIDKV